MATNESLSSMSLSPAERAVVRAMRYSNRSGDAIYRYALSFDNYDPYPPDTTPYIHDKHPYEAVFDSLPGEESVRD